MNVNKGLVALLIVAVMLSSGLTYAVTQVIDRTTINIVKPESVSFGVRYADSDLGADPGITPNYNVINLDEWDGNSVSATSSMVNGGSKDLTLTWTTENLPDGLTVQLYIDGLPWVDTMKLVRSTSVVLTIQCIDDGTLAEGSSTFDLVITAQ